jgi:outer membrane lipopolysaccharide assembly protein LptE/RlpB
MVYKIYTLFLSLIILMLLGCSYSFKGSLPSHIQKVAVPLFDDNTAYPGIREDLTNGVIDEFIADNTLKVASESEADIIISGVVSSIRQRASMLTGGETVQEYQVYVTVRVKCEDVKNNKLLWEKTISQYGIMSAAATQDERDQAIGVAIEKITNDILNNTLGFW